MALVVLRVGSAEDVFQYDDGSYDSAIETTAPIKSGTPVDPNDVIRLEDLEGRLLNPVSVVNIANPTELNSIEGVLGALILAYQPIAATVINRYTIYAYDASGPAVNAPYIMDADGAGDERWIAIAGEYSIYGTGNVQGPAVAIDNNIALFNGVTGKTIKDSGILITNVVIGPAAATDNAIARFDLATGKIIQNSGVIIDNSDNLTTPGMLRQGNTWHAYGGFEDQAETIACGVGDWNHITNAGNNLWNLDENDGISEAADVFTITNAGDYEGVLSISISGLNGKDFHVRVYNNTQAAVMGRPIGMSTTGVNNEMNVCVPIYIEADAGDAIQFEIMSADGTDPIVDDALFIIKYLHD